MPSALTFLFKFDFCLEYTGITDFFVHVKQIRYKTGIRRRKKKKLFHVTGGRPKQNLSPLTFHAIVCVTLFCTCLQIRFFSKCTDQTVDISIRGKK